MVAGYFAAHSATIFSVRMTNLSIKLPAKCWKLRVLNVNLVTALVNTRAFGAKYVIVKIMFVEKVSNMTKISPFRVPSATLTLAKLKTLACQVSLAILNSSGTF